MMLRAPKAPAEWAHRDAPMSAKSIAASARPRTTPEASLSGGPPACGGRSSFRSCRGRFALPYLRSRRRASLKAEYRVDRERNESCRISLGSQNETSRVYRRRGREDKQSDEPAADLGLTARGRSVSWKQTNASKASVIRSKGRDGEPRRSDRRRKTRGGWDRRAGKGDKLNRRCRRGSTDRGGHRSHHGHRAPDQRRFDQELGRLVGNPKLQADGIAERQAGKEQNVAGGDRDLARQAVRDGMLRRLIQAGTPIRVRQRVEALDYVRSRREAG